LSGNITIVTPSEYNYAQAPTHYREQHYVLCDALRNRDFLINETVKYFLDKFSIPRTKTTVIKEIAAECNSGVREIKKACAVFFNFLVDRRVIVTEDEKEVSTKRVPLLKEGDQFQDFTIMNILSNKHYVDVYLAKHRIEDQAYVIKLLNKNKTREETIHQEELKDLEREYDLLHHVRHLHHISQVFGFNKNDTDCPYITLEYIQGKSLSRLLKQAVHLQQETCTTITARVLQAFAELHENKIIHGDIHPSNILVSDDFKVKIIDLGLAIDGKTDRDEVLKMGGVNYYMPPERINICSLDKFSKEPGFRSDVYQIGLVLYFILYKKPPYTAYTWEELAHRIKQEEPEFPELTFLQAPVSPFLINMIKKSIHKDTRKRYASAATMYRDFNKTLTLKTSKQLS
jgi:serine/threonine protein kinase